MSLRVMEIAQKRPESNSGVQTAAEIAAGVGRGVVRPHTGIKAADLNPVEPQF